MQLEYKYIKKILEFIALVLAILVSYYTIKTSITPNEIILEVERFNMSRNISIYSLTGVTSDKDYLLESIKIIPDSNNPVKRATFNYDNYTQAIELEKLKNTNPTTYMVSKTILKKEFGKDFSFMFLDNNRFTFHFEFIENIDNNPTQFRCQVLTIKNFVPPCKVKEKGYLSLFRGIPWYFFTLVLFIIFIIFIKIIILFIKRGGGQLFKRRKGRSSNSGGINPVKD